MKTVTGREIVSGLMELGTDIAHWNKKYSTKEALTKKLVELGLTSHQVEVLGFMYANPEHDTVSDAELQTLKHLGGNENGNVIAVDDYGTGHSNIVNLLRYSPQVIKIDRFLITDIQNDVNKQMFVRSTIDLARLNGIKVLAEGVETSAELRAFRDFAVF